MRKCNTCFGNVQWIECPTGGWWAHLQHPADGHDADVTEVVPLEQLYEFAMSLSVEAEEQWHITREVNECVQLARTLMTDLLERGWRPPVE